MYGEETGSELLNIQGNFRLGSNTWLSRFPQPTDRPLCLSRGQTHSLSGKAGAGQGFSCRLKGYPYPGLRVSAAGLLLLLLTLPGGANAALRCSQGCGWKFEPLLGEELDLRRVTWRLPPELIPRLSASSGRSDEDSSVVGGVEGEGCGWIRGATPRPPGGDRLLSHARLSGPRLK